MTQRIVHPEWRQYFETTKYPFSDTATLTNQEEDQNFIPEGVFLDAALYPVGGRARLYLSKVVIAADTATLYIGDPVVSELASGIINLLDPDDEVVLVDTAGRPAGVLVSESARLLSFQGWTDGEHTFDISDTEFVARVCLPTPEVGVRGFQLDDGSVLTGDVWFVGDDGVVLTHQTASEPDPAVPGGTREVQVIRIDVVGDPLYRRRLCEGVFTTPNFLQTITAREGCREVVCEGDESGNVLISVGSQDAPDTILRIRATSEGLVFETVGERQEGLG